MGVKAPLDEQALLKRWVEDPLFFAETFLTVEDMTNQRTVGELTRFSAARMPAQADMVARIWVAQQSRLVVLKARRVGATTLFMSMGLALAQTHRNFRMGLIAQNQPEAINFGRMWKRMYDNMTPATRLPSGAVFQAKVPADPFSDNMIGFPTLGSWLAVGTAGSNKLWRGQGLSLILGTEVSKWDVGRPIGTAEETWAMAEGALAPGAIGILESTAYGSGGFFFDSYMNGKESVSAWTSVFYPWWWHPIYSLEPGSSVAREQDRGALLLTPEESRLDLSEDQIRWRRSKISSMPGRTEEARKSLFLQEYPENDTSCFAVSGAPFFDPAKIGSDLALARPPTRTDDDGALTMWQLPRVGELYIIGVDPGGTTVAREKESLSYASAIIIDSRAEHVATLHGRWDASRLAEVVAKVATYYNKAQVIVESGPYGDPVLMVLATYLRYPNVYSERDPVTRRIIGLGKRTASDSKPAMADCMKELYETGVFHTNDRDLLAEMRNFHRVPSETGYIQLKAIAGHDDRVMASLMACWAYRDGSWRQMARRHKVLTPGGD